MNNLCEAAICKKVVAEIPGYWSLKADETQDFPEVEQLRINNDAEVCEDFLGFLKLISIIVDVMIPSLPRSGLDFSLLVAQRL